MEIDDVNSSDEFDSSLRVKQENKMISPKVCMCRLYVSMLSITQSVYQWPR